MDFCGFLKNNTVILDGGMGTLLQGAGLKPGENTALWNLSHPEVITQVHRRYYEAGSNVVSTNTFGAHLMNFSKQELESIIPAAVENAKKAKMCFADGKDRFIALDIGPTGKMLKPYGDLDFEDAVDVFRTSAAIGAKCGVDLIYIETINDIYEAKAAVLGVKEACDLPVMISCAFDENGKMMTGATPEILTAVAEGLGVCAVGLNCSLGPDRLIKTAQRFIAAAGIPVIFKPNAGLPDSLGHYGISPGEFAGYAKKAQEMGVRLLGGCCGTSPEFILEVSNTVRDLPVKDITQKNSTVACSYTKTLKIGDGPVIIGERINPTGKKLLKQALAARDMNYILNEALEQEKCGADCLDVNVGAPGVDETELLPMTVNAVQEVTDLPLQLDSANGAALEKAMRVYNGKPVVNSVNGSLESMRTVFPLIKKYGGVVVALTLDENGIPQTAGERVAIAEKIVAEAEKYGIKKKDIIFDTLTTTVATDPLAARITVDALREIKEKLGCKTVLGVSNVSFGLPERSVMNSAFLSMALFSGLDAAIINPCSPDMIRSFVTFRALTGLDCDFTAYTDFAVRLEKPASSAPAKEMTLSGAIVKGLSENAAELTKKALSDTQPTDIISGHIIPALNEVGAGYESGKIFLPGLLAAANAAKSAFSVIRDTSSASSVKNGVRIVLATVKGDVHDIGKNIVRLLLENYGFDVTDLGKDVAPETVADEVIRLHADFAGLSALMTTTLPAMEQTVRLLKEKAPFCKTVVGGAVVTQDYADTIGADFYAADAMATVKIAQR